MAELATCVAWLRLKPRERLAKGTRPRDDEPVFTASLVAEPANAYDANAVAVAIEPFGKVGYLPRDIAKRYSPLLVAAGGIARCPVQLRGGTGSKPSIGVVLDAARVEGPPLLDYDPERPMDYDGIAQYHKLRDMNRQFVAETRPLESTSLEAAIERYRKALSATIEYERFATERKLFPRLRAQGDIVILDRLTLCLIKAGRPSDAVDEADLYFAEFPDALELKAGQTVKGRIEKRRA